MEPHKAEALLADFKTLPRIKQIRPTLLEVAGYPHYENVCSNILAFFFDSEEPHGLQGLAVTSLLRAVGREKELENIDLENVVVEREVRTDSGNRLDILVQTDTHLIGIENKIFAGLYNPLDDYAKYLKKRKGKDELNVVKIVLSLLDNQSGMRGGFENVTYEKFISELRSQLGFYVADADARYVMLLVDLMSSMENLKRGQTMDQEWVNFLESHKEDIEDMWQQINKFRGHLRGEVKRLGGMIVCDSSVVNQRLWRETDLLCDILVHDIKIADDLIVGIDTVLSAKGWEIQVFVRPGGNRDKLKALVDSSGLKFDEKERFVCTETFPFNAQLESIQPLLQKVVDYFAGIALQNKVSQAGAAQK